MYAEEPLELEQILSKFKLSGRYYLKLFSLLIFSGVTNAFYSVNYVFAVADVGYRCKYPKCEGSDANFTIQPYNFTIDNRCSKYTFFESQDCSFNNVDTSQVRSCRDWIFETPDSFVEEMQIACEDLKRTLVGTVHSFGYMIGLLIIGPLADKVGRKKLIIFSGLTASIMGLSRSFISYYWAYIALELIEALFGDTYSTTFMLGVEMVTKDNRVTFITVMTACTSLAGMLMSLIAWSLPHWRHFLRAIYGPSLLFIFYIFMLDESVRWLLIKGKTNEAKDILKRAAKMNKVDLKDHKIDVKPENDSTKSNMTTLLKMTFGSRKILSHFFICVCMWITGIFNKYTLLINSVHLEGNKYLNFALTTFTELPASLILIYTLKRFKRKIPLIVSFVLTGVFCVAQTLVPKGNAWLSICLFLIGKFMATISYATTYLYTSELFPTYTRNTMHALCSSLGRIAAMLAPQTPLLMRYWTGFPYLIVSGMSVITGVLVTFLPETSEDVLPDTVREAEAVGTRQTGNALSTSTKL